MVEARVQDVEFEWTLIADAVPRAQNRQLVGVAQGFVVAVAFNYAKVTVLLTTTFTLIYQQTNGLTTIGVLCFGGFLKALVRVAGRCCYRGGRCTGRRLDGRFPVVRCTAAILAATIPVGHSVCRVGG